MKNPDIAPAPEDEIPDEIPLTEDEKNRTESLSRMIAQIHNSVGSQALQRATLVQQRDQINAAIDNIDKAFSIKAQEKDLLQKDVQQLANDIMKRAGLEKSGTKWYLDATAKTYKRVE